MAGHEPEFSWSLKTHVIKFRHWHFRHIDIDVGTLRTAQKFCFHYHIWPHSYLNLGIIYTVILVICIDCDAIKIVKKCRRMSRRGKVFDIAIKLQILICTQTS